MQYNTIDGAALYYMSAQELSIMRSDKSGVSMALAALGDQRRRGLSSLDPSDEEMLVAARWCLTQDASELFPSLVISFLEKEGYLDVANQLKTDS